MNNRYSPQVRKGLPPAAFFALGALFVMVVLFWLSRSSSVSANSGDIALAENTYPNIRNSRIDTCALCHTSSIPNLNPFGSAYNSGGRGLASSLRNIESADSDGDGFSNLAELTALTFPGNATDRPVTAPTATNTVPAPTATSTRPAATATSTSPAATATSTSPAATATSTRPAATATKVPTGMVTATPKVSGTPGVTKTPKLTKTPKPTKTPTLSPTPCSSDDDDDDRDGEDSLSLDRSTSYSTYPYSLNGDHHSDGCDRDDDDHDDDHDDGGYHYRKSDD